MQSILRALPDAQIAFDPNIRLSLWPSESMARETILEHLSMCNFIKLSSDELFFLTEQNNIEDGVKKIYLPSMQLLAITDGKNGATLYTKDDCVSHPGYATHVIDTTGAATRSGEVFSYSSLGVATIRIHTKL